MALSSQLARLRAEKKVISSSTTVPSILFEQKEAAELNLEDVQGLGRNGLQALGSISTAFHEYEHDLRLQGGMGAIAMTDRSLFGEEEEREIANAVTSICRLLGNVWLLRPAQKVCEWLIRGLRVGEFGEEGEVDALIVMALPYHATREFVRWVRCVLGQRWGAEVGRKWRWLKPCVDQNKPVDRHFLAKGIQSAAIFVVLNIAKKSAEEGIVNSSLCALVATTLTEAMIVSRRGLSSDLHDGVVQRRLVLRIVEVLGTKSSLSNADAISETQAAAVVVLVSACSAGLISDDVDVMKLLILALAKLMYRLHRRSKKKATRRRTDLYRGTLIAFAYTLSMSGLDQLELRTLECLVQVDCLVSDLAGVLPDKSATASDTIRVYTRSLAREARDSDLCFRSLVSVFSADCAAVTKEVVIEALSTFFDACDDSNFDSAQKKNLAMKISNVITPISRGEHAEALDRAVRQHLLHRGILSGTFSAIDMVFMKALGGTSCELLDLSQLESERISRPAIISALDHPEAAIRVAAIKKLHSVEDPSQELREALLRRAVMDEDHEVLDALLTSTHTVPLCTPGSLLEALIERSWSLSEAAEKGGSLPMLLFEQVVRGIQRVSCMITGDSTFQVKALSSLLGLAAADAIGNVAFNGVISALEGFSENGEGFAQDLGKEIRCALSSYRSAQGIEAKGRLSACGEETELEHGKKKKKKNRRQKTAKKGSDQTVGSTTVHDSGSDKIRRKSGILSAIAYAISQFTRNQSLQRNKRYLDFIADVIERVHSHIQWWGEVLVWHLCRELVSQVQLGNIETRAVAETCQRMCYLSVSVSPQPGGAGAPIEVRRNLDFADSVLIKILSGKRGASASYAAMASFALLSKLNPRARELDKELLCKGFEWFASACCEGGIQELLGAIGGCGKESEVSRFLLQQVAYDRGLQSVLALEALVAYVASAIQRDKEDFTSLVLALLRNSCSDSSLMREAIKNCASSLVHSLGNYSQDINGDVGKGFTMQNVQAVLEAIQKRPVQKFYHKPPAFDNQFLENDALESGLLHKYDWPGQTLRRARDGCDQNVTNFVLRSAMQSSENWYERVKSLRFVRGAKGDESTDCEFCLIALNDGLGYVSGRLKFWEERAQLLDHRRRESETALLPREDCLVLEFLFLTFERMNDHLWSAVMYSKLVTTLIDTYRNQYVEGHPVPTPLLQVAVYTGFRLVVSNREIPAHEELVKELITCASRSSLGGSLSFALLQAFPLVSSKMLYQHIRRLRDFMSSRSGRIGKKPRTESGKEGSKSAEKTVTEATKALELMIRLDSDTVLKNQQKFRQLSIFSSPVSLRKHSEFDTTRVILLFDTLHEIVKNASNELDEIVTGLEYVLQLLLSAIEGSLKYNPVEMKSANLWTKSQIEDICACIQYSAESTEIQDPMKAAICTSAIAAAIAMSTIAPGIVAEDGTRIFNLLAERGGPSSLEGVQALLSNLKDEDLDIKQLIARVTTIIYSKRKQKIEREILLACISAAGSKVEAIRAFLRTLTTLSLEEASFVDEVLDILEISNMSLLDQLAVLGNHSSVAVLATSYFSRDSVLRAIAKVQQSGMTKDEDCTEGRLTSLQEGFIDRMMTILDGIMTESSERRDAALGSLFGVSAIDVYLGHLERSLDAKQWHSVSEALDALVSRINLTHIPFHSMTRSDPDVMFVNRASQIINGILSLSVNEFAEGERCDIGGYWLLKQRATTVLLQLCEHLGHVRNDSVPSCAKVLANELKQVKYTSFVPGKTRKGDIDAQAYQASVVLALANVIGTYQAKMVTHVPMLLAACADIMSSTMGNSLKARSGLKKNPVFGAALQAVGVLVLRTPRFMPSGPVETIFLAGARDDANKDIQDICSRICVEGRHEVVLSALMSAMQSTSDAEVLCFLLELTKEAVFSMRRIDLKRQVNFLMKLLLKGLSFRQKLSEERDAPVQEKSSLKMVEESSAELAVTWALKLPESEFSYVVKEFRNWVSEKDDSLHRKIGLYTVSLSWFKALKILFSPFFAELLEDACKVLNWHTEQKGDKANTKKSKKRKRAEFEEEDKDYWELRDIALQCIVEYLRHMSATEVSEDVMMKLIECILSSFDAMGESASQEYSVVFEAFLVLGERIVTNGAVAGIKNKEESRQMLMAVSRDIFKRASESHNWHVRAAAAAAVRKFALGAGEEYLAALPEAMQPLSELLEDEAEGVQSSGRALIRTLEELSGEKIMGQLIED